LHQRIVSEHASGENLPCADTGFLAAIQRSAEYHAIRHQVTSGQPVDSWKEDGFHFFVFQLLSPHEMKGNQLEAPMAVFTMHPESQDPISAVIVAPTPDGTEAKVLDLRPTGQSYSAPLAS
jgi:hypothetical protein